MPQPHVVVVSLHFHPDMASTGQLLTDLAVELRKRGMTVSALTAQPRYGGTGSLPARELFCGVEIDRITVPAPGTGTPSGRMGSALTFAALVTWRLWRGARSRTLLLVTNPPVLPLVGAVLKRLRGQRYVILVNDIYPDIAIRLGYLRSNGWAARIWRWLNRWMYTNADGIVALERRMADRIADAAGGPGIRSRIEVIHNWSYPDSIRPVRREENGFCRQHGIEGGLVVLYAGNMGLFHDLETLVGAAKRLAQHKDVVFLFIGEGGKKQAVADLVRRWNLPNVRLMPFQSREQLPLSLTCGDVAAVTLAKGAEGLCMPSKLYTSLAAGQAILAIIGRDSEVGEIIDEYRCGTRVDPGDVDGVVAALLGWLGNPASLDEMKRNARRCFEQRFTKQHAVQQYYTMLSRVGAA